MQRSRTKDLFLPLALALVVSAAVMFFFLVKNRSQNFPEVVPGIYQGRISGIAGEKRKYYTMYLERIEESDNLLVIVFKAGWRPQVVPLTWGEEVSEDGLRLLNPIEIKGGGETLRLAGISKGSGYAGEVLGEETSIGSWALQEIDASEIKRNFEGIEASMTQGGWLDFKLRLRELQTELVSLGTSLSETNTRYGRIKKFVDDEDLLRKRALRQRRALESDISEASANQEAVSKDVGQLVSKLDLSTRISKRGRVVSLARSVASRENKWYLANWSAKADASGVDELLARRMRVSLRQMKAGEKKANEIESLRQQISRESERIKELKQMLKEKIDRAIEKKEQKEKKRGKSLLERVFG